MTPIDPKEPKGRTSEAEAIRHEGRVVRAEMATTASPDRVYAAFADPERLSSWFTERARGTATAGGTMTWVFERFGFEVTQEVVIADPGSRLVLRSEPPGRPRSVVDVTIEHDGGRTRLRLVNSGFGDADGAGADDQVAGVESGWAMALGLLRHYLEKHDGKSRSEFLVMRPARFDFAEAYRRYTTSEGLRSWLADDAETDGKTFSFTLPGGRRLTGDVLVQTKSETALAAREVDGVLELKAFHTGPDAAVLAVRASFWGPRGAEHRDALEPEFGAAIERLARAIEAR